MALTTSKVLTEGFLGGFLGIAGFFMTICWALVIGFTTVVTLVVGLIFDMCTTVLTLEVGFTNVRAFFVACTTMLTIAVGSIKVCDFLVV